MDIRINEDYNERVYRALWHLIDGGKESRVINDIEHWYNATDDSEYVIQANDTVNDFPIVIRREFIRERVSNRTPVDEKYKWFDIDKYTPSGNCKTVVVAFNDSVPETGVAAVNVGVAVASRDQAPSEWRLVSSDDETMCNATKFMLLQ